MHGQEEIIRGASVGDSQSEAQEEGEPRAEAILSESNQRVKKDDQAKQKETQWFWYQNQRCCEEGERTSSEQADIGDAKGVTDEEGRGDSTKTPAQVDYKKIDRGITPQNGLGETPALSPFFFVIEMK